ncbi:MAG: hypothetical protein HW387_1762 [Parachlamydiales bacterium]|nr:hypothetical protein [Parachlamydiales bacterium]
MTLETLVRLREDIPFISMTDDLLKITSPAQVGFCPDSVLSVFDYFILGVNQIWKWI